ncbi:TPA: hypothetical protein RRY44_003979 [Klebsiella pneumoniae]|nr:hypothetical protein [Klebsiella pneumoniae]HDZ1953642.1 hypothetical protein [Klebsiella pneumoniae]
MTKSTITRARLETLANAEYCKSNPGAWLLGLKEVNELARMALVAMDSEPDCNERQLFCSTDTARMKKVISVSAGSEDAPLYRHAQPVLEIESEPVFTLEVARADYKGQKLGNHFGFITLDAARELKEGNYQLYTAQPAPVVPEEKPIPNTLSMYAVDAVAAIAEVKGWNACRAAMLAASPQEIKS